MSRFVGSQSPVFFAAVIIPDERILMAASQWDSFSGSNAQVKPFQDGVLWPSARFYGSDANGTGLFGQDAATTSRYESLPIDEGGAQHQLMIAGTARDANGVALSGATIKCYTTADDVERGVTVSQTDGSFRCPTSQTGAHYIVAYKAGSPDLTGATVNTLTGV